ncbi:d-amino-acid oxidase [Moniliophthora roreri MCA 2997]|uniref:D-amino-acid oxidase n=2 Tax=Moniliophthora roreri TaxID=221103 RepID=V2XUW0_MONRO|nr:d-amino-acid oxidase [Moniliophthora roreri MCA 2997]KAI3602836.1 d-amino-acid oxidase [Moniliophthora roreri]
MASQTHHIIIIGAGVVGLSTAIKIQEKGHRVSIIAESFPNDPKNIRYTSLWAGAQQVSVGQKHEEKLRQFELETYKVMWEMSSPGSPSEKCFKRCTDRTYYASKLADPHPCDYYPDFKFLPEDKLIPGAVQGVSFSTLTIDPPTYLNYLLSRFCGAGGIIVRGTVSHIVQVIEGGIGIFSHSAPSPPDAIVICAGLGTRFLGGIEDKAMYPIRGQTVLLRAPWVQDMPCFFRDDRNPAYVIPRGSGNVLVGGTFHANDWYPKPRPEITQEMLEHAISLCPELAPPEIRSEREPTVEDLKTIIIEEGVGLRPARHGGIRLGVEWMDTVVSERKIPVVFNYGHGGYGYQSSWGSAAAAVDILEGALMDSRLM